jgi:hypothetical protein
MSRGPGRVEREIEALLLAHPDATFTVSEIARHVFGLKTVTPAQSRSVRRALRHVFERNPAWSPSGVRTRRNHPSGPGGDERLIYNTSSWESVKAAGRAGYMGDGEDAARARYFTSLKYRTNLLRSAPIGHRFAVIASERRRVAAVVRPIRFLQRPALRSGRPVRYPFGPGAH